MIDTFGGSVTGPAHRVRRAANEDAWLHRQLGTCGAVVVSDGLGSRPHARRGARAACAAALHACRTWTQTRAGVNSLIDVVHAEWLRRIAPEAAADCACTCQFAVVDSDGRGVLARLGDGLALVRRMGRVEVHGRRAEDAFSNETAAMDARHRPRAWSLTDLEAGTDAVVLCTDGVGDDLLPDRLGAFANWVIDEIGALAPVPRWRALVQALTEWPTPQHLDDKTIAALVVRGIRHA